MLPAIFLNSPLVEFAREMTVFLTTKYGSRIIAAANCNNSPMHTTKFHDRKWPLQIVLLFVNDTKKIL